MSADATRAEPALLVEGVSKRFGGLLALDRTSLDVRPGSITALIGPNGAGKTTLFNVITGFVRPNAGRIVFRGSPIEGKPPYALARLGLVRTFQITKALTKMSVLDNLLLAAPDQPGERFWQVWAHPRTVAAREREIRDRAGQMLDLFQLSALANDYAGTLSGGQRKLLELARALMAEPTLMLLDEPMAGVNPTLGRRLLDRIREVRDQLGVTFLYIEHDMEVVMNHSDRVIVMGEGRVIADGLPDDIRRDPTVIDAYLGSAPAPA